MIQEDKERSRSADMQDEANDSQKKDVGSQLNIREDETEPLGSEAREAGQESTTGTDYATREGNTIEQGGPGRNQDNSRSSSQNLGDETKETSVNEFSQAPESDNTKKVTKSIYGEGAIRKDEELPDPQKRLEDHPGAYQLKDKSVDEEKDYTDEDSKDE